MVRGRIVHIRRQPHGISDAGAFHERQQIGNLVFAPLRRPITKRNRVFADHSDRQVRGNDLPGRARGRELALQPGQLGGTQDEAVAAVVTLVPGRIAVAAHVDQENIEQRPVSYPAIDAPLLLGNGADRHEFEKRLACARHQSGGAVFGVTGLVGTADRRPVVGHFMVVPLRQHRHLRMKGAQIVIEQIVSIISAKLRQAVRDRGFLLGHDIPPGFPVRQFQLSGHRTVGVDVIAAMDEKVGAVFEHGLVGSHATASGIDAPALARGITRPDK